MMMAAERPDLVRALLSLPDPDLYGMADLKEDPSPLASHSLMAAEQGKANAGAELLSSQQTEPLLPLASPSSVAPLAHGGLPGTASAAAGAGTTGVFDNVSVAPTGAPADAASNDGTSRAFLCRFCNKSFSQKGNLTSHLRSHTGERPFSCTVCSKAFSHKGNLTKHLRIHTGDKPYACTHCPKRFSVKYSLTVHLRTHSGERPFPCTECTKSFSVKDRLTVHMRTHTGERPFKCTECGRAFFEKSSLTTHLRTHSGERPYACTICDKTYIDKSSLNMHLRAHSGERPYSCDQCAKTFSHKSNLTRHRRTHESHQRPFACHLCPKTYNQLASLNVHVQSHLIEVKAFTCQICGEAHGRQCDLAKHLNTCHPQQMAALHTHAHYSDSAGAATPNPAFSMHAAMPPSHLSKPEHVVQSLLPRPEPYLVRPPPQQQPHQAPPQFQQQLQQQLQQQQQQQQQQHQQPVGFPQGMANMVCSWQQGAYQVAATTPVRQPWALPGSTAADFAPVASTAAVYVSGPQGRLVGVPFGRSRLGTAVAAPSTCAAYSSHC